MQLPASMITYITIGVTALISLMAFNNPQVVQKGIFHPLTVWKEKEYYRFVTSGFLHSNMSHLFFNMFSLYFFGGAVEGAFKSLFGSPMYILIFVAFYLTAIIISEIPTYLKHRHDAQYSSLGASGGVSAIVFASIVFDPFSKILIFPIPFPLPAYIFAILYLLYSYYQSLNAKDNVNHDAHLYGALYGLVFVILLSPSRALMVLQEIIFQIQHLF